MAEYSAILAISDLHYAYPSQKLVELAKRCDYVFFLGDGIVRLGDIAKCEGIHIVKGNCDALNFPEEEVVEVDGVRIFLTHGHRYGVKDGLLKLTLRAKELGCSATFYGHTHYADISEYDGVQLLCPGSLSSPRCGIATFIMAVVEKGKLQANLVNADF